jgi:hypothetical protein
MKKGSRAAQLHRIIGDPILARGGRQMIVTGDTGYTRQQRLSISQSSVAGPEGAALRHSRARGSASSTNDSASLRCSSDVTLDDTRCSCRDEEDDAEKGMGDIYMGAARCEARPQRLNLLSKQSVAELGRLLRRPRVKTKMYQSSIDSRARNGVGVFDISSLAGEVSPSAGSISAGIGAPPRSHTLPRASRLSAIATGVDHPVTIAGAISTSARWQSMTREAAASHKVRHCRTVSVAAVVTAIASARNCAAYFGVFWFSVTSTVAWNR